jgi:hypothetical protein
MFPAAWKNAVEDALNKHDDQLTTDDRRLALLKDVGTATALTIEGQADRLRIPVIVACVSLGAIAAGTLGMFTLQLLAFLR